MTAGTRLFAYGMAAGAIGIVAAGFIAAGFFTYLRAHPLQD